MSRLFIGTSGYAYQHWVSVFYPEELSQREWLEYYCQYFSTVELNVTFYRLPSSIKIFQNWYQRTPVDFTFSLKGLRLITHIKRLNHVEEPLQMFFERVRGLGEKLEVVLWQFPSFFRLTPKTKSLLTDFCRLLEKEPSCKRYAFEFRDESFFSSWTYQLLEKHNMALVFCDYPFNLTTTQPKTKNKRRTILVPETADFVYLRRHGVTDLYSSNYSQKQLQDDAGQINRWLASKKDVYLYFNNDAKGFAVKNALELKNLVKNNKEIKNSRRKDA